MKITKIGHCCLLIEHEGVRILTDPGAYTAEEHSKVTNIDVVLITHEHGDHLHTESLKEILANNSGAKVTTNTSTGKMLDEEGIAYTIVEDGGKDDEKILVEGFGNEHQEIYKEFGQVQNTGYFIADKLFYPGDSFYNPGKSVDVLALPVAGPWTNIKQAVEYGLEIKPNKAFPVHDGMFSEGMPGSTHKIPEKFLGEEGIEFISMKAGDEIEL